MKGFIINIETNVRMLDVGESTFDMFHFEPFLETIGDKTFCSKLPFENKPVLEEINGPLLLTFSCFGHHEGDLASLLESLAQRSTIDLR